MRWRTSRGVAKGRSTTRAGLDRGLALTVLTGLGLLLVIGVVFSVAYGSQRITTAAVEQQQTAESLRFATIVRAQVAAAVLLGSIEGIEADTNTTAPRAVAMEQADEALAELVDGVGRLSGDGGSRLEGTDISEHTAEYVQVSSAVLAALHAEDFATARAISDTQLDASYQTLAGDFIALRDTLDVEIRDADTLLGRIGNIARFLVAFFIPAAVIIVYRELVVRRQRALELETRLESERQMARAREEFVANASHELRTPLTGIAGMAMLLEEDLHVGGSDLSRELVDVIIRESSDLERIVEDLLTTARLDAGALHFSFEDVNVAPEVAEAAASLMRNGVDVDVKCRSGVVRVDRTRLRQVVRNLLSNAMKYGGPSIRIDGQAVGQSYVLVIADNGDGLPDRVEEHLFERFVHRESDDARTDSVGLGLSIVHALVVGMGGAISYGYQDGESRFTIRLPLASRSIRPSPAPAEATSTAGGAGSVDG